MWWLLLTLGCMDPAMLLDPKDEAVHEAMAGHEADAQDARRAVIDGRLADARAAAKRLGARLPIPGLSGPAQARLRDAARRIEDATNVDGAGRALGELGAACAECHLRERAWVPSLLGAPPKPDGTLKGAMASHRWAEEALWLGLIAGSERQFEEGATVLATANLAPEGVAGVSGLPRLASEQEIRVHDLASMAARADDPERRAELYGQFVGACASCHAAFR